MTIEDAIKHAEEVAQESRCRACADEHRQLAKWLKELKRLRERQPHEDCVSRERAIETVMDWYFDFLDGKEIKDFINSLDALPPVTPVQKKGHWIQTAKYSWRCSECGQQIYSETEADRLEFYAFCGRCGAKMEDK